MMISTPVGSFSTAVREALRQVMEEDPTVVIMGEDVTGGAGTDTYDLSGTVAAAAEEPVQERGCLHDAGQAVAAALFASPTRRTVSSPAIRSMSSWYLSSTPRVLLTVSGSSVMRSSATRQLAQSMVSATPPAGSGPAGSELMPVPDASPPAAVVPVDARTRACRALRQLTGLDASLLWQDDVGGVRAGGRQHGAAARSQLPATAWSIR